MKNVFFLALLIISFSVHGQKVSNKFSFAKGQKLEFITNMNMVTESMMGESTGNITIADSYTVNEATANTTQFLKIPRQIKISFSIMGKDYTIDSDKKDDMEGQFGGPIKDLMKQQATFSIDGGGKITAVKNDGKKKEEAESAGMMGMMMPGMNMNAGLPVAGTASVFKVLPDYEVGKGDTWYDSINVEGNKSVTNYTITDITDTEILIDYVGNANTVSTQSAMGMNMEVSATTTSKGTITLDKATGILKQKTATNATESNMNMGGREIASSVKTTAVTTIKTL